jgi:murein peptide amidase A
MLRSYHFYIVPTLQRGNDGIKSRNGQLAPQWTLKPKRIYNLSRISPSLGHADNQPAKYIRFSRNRGGQGNDRRLARLLFCGFFLLTFLPAVSAHGDVKVSQRELCARIVAKLASVDAPDCTADRFFIGGYSHLGMPLLLREYPPLAHRRPQARVLLIGGTHGDEYSSISIVFKWMRILDEHHSGLFHWLVMPLLNPDGLLMQQSRRTNARGVDLNRNMPASEWHAESHARWAERADGNPRYFPGQEPASEPESLLLMQAIASFDPQAIVSVHAPLNLIDYDGSGTPPTGFGGLTLRRLGNFPGTLGHYAGRQMGIPVVTVELASSTRMPAESETIAIWTDLVRWLTEHIPAPPGPKPDDPILAEDFMKKETFSGK